MKRKKLYSMLALSMAITLAVGVPVSAAEATGSTSVSTGNTDITVTEDMLEKDTVDGQEVTTAKDGNDVIYAEIENSVGANEQIDQWVQAETSMEAKKNDEKVTVEIPAALEEEARKANAEESKKQLNLINVDKIKVDKDGLTIKVTPVLATVQSVAKDAADQMATKLGLAVAENGLVASADIAIPNFDPAQGAVRVTIPMKDAPEAGVNYFVLHYNMTNGEWETLPAQITEDGIVVATFSSFSPVFVVKANALPDDANNEDNSDGNNGDGGSDDSSSPASSQKAAPAPVANTPVDPAVSPKTGE